MRNSEAYATLQQELTLAMEHVQGQYEKYLDMKRRSRVTETPEEIVIAAIGFSLHNLYNAMENYFLRISKFFENELSRDSWHRDLVNRMALSIEGVRPALLDRETLKPFQELRAFRHVFRTIYDSTLEPRKVALVEEEAPNAVEILEKAHVGYLAKLGEIRRGLES
ncbi:MAG: hypothetical protein ACLFPW_12640 [Spirochaetaceae bacterium]